MDWAQMKSNLLKHKIRKEGECDGRSRFKLAASGRLGLKSHILVGSMCAETKRLQSVSAPRYLYDAEWEALEEKGANKKRVRNSDKNVVNPGFFRFYYE
jgi:hypothetical protein